MKPVPICNQCCSGEPAVLTINSVLRVQRAMKQGGFVEWFEEMMGRYKNVVTVHLCINCLSVSVQLEDRLIEMFQAQKPEGWVALNPELQNDIWIDSPKRAP